MHGVTVEEVENACQKIKRVGNSYKGRSIIEGITDTGKIITIILSSQDREAKIYGNNIYYVITAFEHESEKNN